MSHSTLLQHAILITTQKKVDAFQTFLFEHVVDLHVVYQTLSIYMLLFPHVANKTCVKSRNTCIKKVITCNDSFRNKQVTCDLPFYRQHVFNMYMYR